MPKHKLPKVIGKIEIPELPEAHYWCDTCGKSKHKREFNHIRWAIYECSECEWERNSEEFRQEMDQDY
jgi:ribosomal protein L37AE/L43A